jgi:hypothetical protein
MVKTWCPAYTTPNKQILKFCINDMTIITTDGAAPVLRDSRTTERKKYQYVA